MSIGKEIDFSFYTFAGQRVDGEQFDLGVTEDHLRDDLACGRLSVGLRQIQATRRASVTRRATAHLRTGTFASRSARRCANDRLQIEDHLTAPSDARIGDETNVMTVAAVDVQNRRLLVLFGWTVAACHAFAQRDLLVAVHELVEYVGTPFDSVAYDQLPFRMVRLEAVQDADAVG